jgi:type III secretory pathway component EscR
MTSSKKKETAEEEKIIVIASNHHIKDHVWTVFLALQERNAIKLHATPSNLALAEHVASLFLNMGIDKDCLDKKKTKSVNQNTGASIEVYEITLSKIPALKK